MPDTKTGTVGLNNYLQGKGMLTSLSWLESRSGPRGAPDWTCICKINGEIYGTGTSKQKHVAKDIAANAALEKFGDGN